MQNTLIPALEAFRSAPRDEVLSRLRGFFAGIANLSDEEIVVFTQTFIAFVKTTGIQKDPAVLEIAEAIRLQMLRICETEFQKDPLESERLKRRFGGVFDVSTLAVSFRMVSPSVLR